MGDFSVSLKAPGRNKHFRVHVENNMYCIGQRKFHNLDQLGEYWESTHSHDIADQHIVIRSFYCSWSLPKSTNLHKQTRREIVFSPVATESQWYLKQNGFLFMPIN